MRPQLGDSQRHAGAMSHPLRRLSFNSVGGETAREGKRLDLHQLGDIAGMPSLSLCINEPDDDIEPKPEFANVEVKNIAPFPAASASRHAAKSAHRLNEHDRVVVGAFP